MYFFKINTVLSYYFFHSIFKKINIDTNWFSFCIFRITFLYPVNDIFYFFCIFFLLLCLFLKNLIIIIYMDGYQSRILYRINLFFANEAETY